MLVPWRVALGRLRVFLGIAPYIQLFFFSRVAESFESISNTGGGNPKVSGAFFQGLVGVSLDMFSQCGGVKQSRFSGSRFSRREWVFGIEPSVNGSSADVEPFCRFCFTATIFYEL